MRTSPDPMSFKHLIAKVAQAEAALEAQERQVAADWRQLKGSWRAAWTPGRIVIAGLVAGFFVGRAQPVKTAARGGQAMQLISMLSSLFATTTAREAAGEAKVAAEATTEVADAVAPDTAREARAEAVVEETGVHTGPDPDRLDGS